MFSWDFDVGLTRSQFYAFLGVVVVAGLAWMVLSAKIIDKITKKKPRL